MKKIKYKLISQGDVAYNNNRKLNNIIKGHPLSDKKYCTILFLKNNKYLAEFRAFNFYYNYLKDEDNKIVLLNNKTEDKILFILEYEYTTNNKSWIKT